MSLEQVPPTECERWLAERGVGIDPFFGGREWMRIDEEGVFFDLRQEAIARFGFALLNRATVEALRAHGPFLEVGAGTGYWAHELRRAGIDVIATDPEPFSCVNIKPSELYGTVERLSAMDAIAKYGSGRSLLTVWPSLGRDWIADGLEAFAAQGGTKIIYAGEPEGGCTACARFFEMLDRDWLLLEEVEEFERWEAIHDRCLIYARNGAAGYAPR
jgi:hypothetical protein